VDVEHGFEPHYEIIEGKKKLIAELKAAARKVDEVYLAADPDREGEAICYHLQEELGDRKNGPKIYRVMFNEITKKAIDKAFREARAGERGAGGGAAGPPRARPPGGLQDLAAAVG
jgi:DNA topoisomerase I